VNKGYYDDVPVEKALAFEASLRQFMKSKYAVLMDKLEQTKDMNAEAEKGFSAAIEDFKKDGTF
jgi:F-type H+-transporting ATPase subunit alpha